MLEVVEASKAVIVVNAVLIRLIRECLFAIVDFILISAAVFLDVD